MVFATRKHHIRHQRRIEAVGEPAPPVLNRCHTIGRYAEELGQPDADGGRLLERLLNVIGVENPYVPPLTLVAPLLLPVLLLGPPARGDEHERGRSHVDPEWVGGAAVVVASR